MTHPCQHGHNIYNNQMTADIQMVQFLSGYGKHAKFMKQGVKLCIAVREIGIPI